MTSVEASRLEVQRACDAQKSRLERNRLGQFATPGRLAREILQFARTLLGSETAVRFLDPAFGTGAFYSALLDTFSSSRIDDATGFEVDSHYGGPAQSIWRGTKLNLRLEDFTSATPDGASAGSNLVICNPPYVRHHHLDGSRKKLLQTAVAEATGLRLSGLAGFYTHFLLLSDRWMATGGIAGWLVPSEFMDVNYGDAVKRYLLENVTLLRIHRFDPSDVQFDDALVSSAVVWFRKTPPPPSHTVEFSYGGSLADPAVLSTVPASRLHGAGKWTAFPRILEEKLGDATAAETKLSDLFRIKRGIATGNNKFFILNEERVRELGISPKFLRPILPSPRHLPGDVVECDDRGNPISIPKLFLIDCALPLPELKLVDPRLALYLEAGAEQVGEAYLCKSRRLWYAQEARSPAPLLCTYMGRRVGSGNAFRFIHNKSRAIAANVYLMMYPNASLRKAFDSDPRAIRFVLEFLNSLPSLDLTSEGRVYGGGLHKLEPRELANVGVDELLSTLGNLAPEPAWRQMPLPCVGDASVMCDQSTLV